MGLVWGRAAAAACVVLSLLVATKAAQAQLHFGKEPMTIVIGSEPGGGYDAYGRIAARHLGRFLPGNPTVVPRNMPGAAGVTETNWLFNSAPKDGTTIGITQNGNPYEALFGNPNAHFDPRKFGFIMSLNRFVDLALVNSNTPFMTAQDAFDKEIIVGGIQNSDPGIMPALTNLLAGSKFKIISGYNSTTEIFLAIDRGEVQGMVGIAYDSYKATKPDWITQKKARILMQVGLARHPELSDVPTVMEFIKDPTDREAAALILARLSGGRPFLAPPGVAPEIVQQLRDSFAAMAKDPDFLADAAKIRAEINITTGEEMEQILARAYQTPKPIVDRAAETLKRAGG
jgi:tripartite-type tricarboxylate transporter receptor subunit TctC